MGAERIVLEGTRRLEQVFAIKDFVAQVAETRMVLSGNHVSGNDDLVEEIPLSLIFQCADTVLA